MKLLGISGSLRANSYNTMLLAEAARVFAPESYELADLRLPLFDEDIEEKPESVLKLHSQIKEADAVIIATPEYNKNLSGVLKNALDWVSRTEGNPWAGKPVAIMSATGGRSGGERAQVSLRLCLQPFRPLILQGPEVLIGGTTKEFDESGRLIGERYDATLATLMADLKSRV